MKPRAGRTVYSTEAPVAKKEAPGDRSGEPRESLPPARQSPRVRRETGGRGGKTVTVAGPLVLTRADAEALLASWKRMCGGGGTLKAGKASDGAPAFDLEVQGDHADRLVADLVRAGYKAKRAGG